jgi:hypothetical protein
MLIFKINENIRSYNFIIQTSIINACSSNIRFLYEISASKIAFIKLTFVLYNNFHQWSMKLIILPLQMAFRTKLYNSFKYFSFSFPISFYLNDRKSKVELHYSKRQQLVQN